MLKLIKGPKSSGKTYTVENRIIEDLKCGKDVVYIVPEQMTATTEGNIIEKCKNIPTVSLEVTNFKRLCNTVFRCYGGLFYNYIDKGARLLVMWQVLTERSSSLVEYSNITGTELETSALFLSAYDELSHYGIDIGELNNISNNPTVYNTSLSAKLQDIASVCNYYEARLSSLDCVDGNGDLKRLKECLSCHRFFENKTVYLDSFYGFTKEELNILEPILRDAENVTVTVLTENDGNEERDIFAGCKKLEFAVKKTAKQLNIKIGEEIFTESRDKYPALAELKKTVFGTSDNKFCGDNSPIRIVECGNMYDEANMIACDICEKVRAGARYRDFAIIAENCSDYSGVIDTVLNSFRIPFYMSSKEELRSKAIVKYALSALKICESNFASRDVISLIKTGLCGIGVEESDIICNYIKLWSISGRKLYENQDWNMNPDGYTDITSDRTNRIIATVNKAKNTFVPGLIKLYDSITGKKTVSEITRALYCFVKNSENICEQDKELSSAYNCLTAAFDSLVNTCGDIKAGIETYTDLLYALIDKMNYGNIPLTSDEVTIGSAGSIRTGRVKTVYVIGVNEGIFPRPADESGIFSDNEKNILESCGYSISKTILSANEDNRLAFYNACCCAEEKVIFSYNTASVTGDALTASEVLQDIAEKFNIATEKFSEFSEDRKIWDYDEAYKYALNSNEPKIKATLQKLYRENGNDLYKLDMNSLPIQNENDTVCHDNASLIFKDNISLSPSRLEKFAECKLSYYCNYVLKLNDAEKISFKASDVGTYMHEILENSIREIKEKYGFPNEELTAQKLDEIVTLYSEKYINENIINSNPNAELKSQLSRLTESAKLLVSDIVDEFAQSKFTPSLFEAKIGHDNGEIPSFKVKVDDNHNIEICGTADRIDTCLKDGSLYIRIVDYKTNGKSFAEKNISKGLNLQMPLYLYSVCKDDNKTILKKIGESGNPEIVPAGVLYCQIKPDTVKLKAEPDKDTAVSKLKETLTRTGLFLIENDVNKLMSVEDKSHFLPKKPRYYNNRLTKADFEALFESVQRSLKNIGESMINGKADASPIKNENNNLMCNYCSYKPICRKKKYADEYTQDNGDADD